MPPSQSPDESHKRTQGGEEIVKTYVMASIGTALIPIPVVDIAALTAVQLKMLHSLSRYYDIPFLKDVGKSITASLLGGLFTGTATGPVAASLVKLIPGYGSAVGLVSLSVVGGASTFAIGRVFIQHFESGGTFLDLDPEAVREHFMNEFEQGKALVTDLKAKSGSGNQNPKT